MAWIKTTKGELVNLDKISSIEIRSSGKDTYYLLAWEAVSPGEGQPSYAEYNNLISKESTKEQAETALVAIQKLVGALTVEELLDRDKSRTGFRRE
ncbi:MAG: hypothetical protein V4671_14930 [Armatimonadota bacterium]